MTPQFTFNHLRANRSFKPHPLDIGRLTEYMRQFVQDGEFTRGDEQSKLLSKHNLHGKDILIGVGDTGIDVKNTFFYDANHPVAYREERIDSEHRKIALYIPLDDRVDYNTQGHGTHVAGIAVGQANNQSISYYNVVSKSIYK